MTPLARGYYQLRIPSISDRQYWEKVRTETQYQGIIKALEEMVAEAAPRPTMPGATDYLAAKRSNDRRRVDTLWQGTRGHLGALAARRCWRGLEEHDADDRLLDWLWAFTTHPTWMVSAHLPGFDLPAAGMAQLDLAACEMAANLAETREALKPWMDSVSATLADTIVAEIDRRVLEPFARDPEQMWWNRRGSLNNWVGVCGGSILAACESLAAQGHPRPAARAQAIASLQRFLAGAFTEHGECDEGVGYWGYGMTFASVGWSRLTAAEVEEHFDVARLREVADYPRRVHLAGDLFFSGNDGGLRGKASLALVPWLAAATGSGWLAEWERVVDRAVLRNFSLVVRTLAGADADAQRAGAVSAVADEVPPRARLLADQQVGIFTVPTGQGNLVACLSGGNNAERHNHNDLGHFLVALGDRVVVPDLGAPSYTSDFFGPQRYTYLAASSRGHCCPLIDGIEQRAGQEAEGKVVAWEEAGAKLGLELAAAYPAEAGLTSWVRGMEAEEAGVVVQDKFVTARGGQRVTEVIWSLEEPRAMEAGWGLGPVTCALEPRAEKVTVETVEADAHRLRDYVGKKVYRIVAEYRTDAGGKLGVAMRFGVAGE